jgi:hypothetical protein
MQIALKPDLTSIKGLFKMIKRLGNLIMGFLHLFTSALEKRNPEVLLELEQENLRKQIGKYNLGLSAHAGLRERLIRQVKRLENEERSCARKLWRFREAGNVKLRELSPFDCRWSSGISREAELSLRAQRKFIMN